MAKVTKLTERITRRAKFEITETGINLQIRNKKQSADMNDKSITKFPPATIHTSIGQVKPRTNNPTYTSTFMNASLCSLSPTSPFQKTLLKETSYRSYFNKPEGAQSLHQNAINYHKFSQDALLKKRSNLSSYGANMLMH